jgi:hypothetical protein
MRDNLLKHLGAGLLLALAIYGLSFYAIEHLRTRKGGWQITFKTNAAGVPQLQIAQPYLGISNLSVAFPEQHLAQTNLSTTVRFDQPITSVPFGKVVYLDTTFLPGSIVLDLFGHQLQLLPRTLKVDRKDIPWQSGTALNL